MKLILILTLFVTVFSQNLFEKMETAKTHVSSGKFNEAIKIYESLVASNSSHPEIWYNLAHAYFQLKEFEKSRNAYTKALNFVEPNDLADVNYNIGNTYMFESKLDTAISYYKKALELNDQDQDSKYNMELARAIIKEKAKKEKQNQKQQNKDQKKQEQPKPSEYAKKIFKEAMDFADRGLFREALDLLNRAKQTDKTVQVFEKTIKKIEEIVTIIES